jgi:acetoacetyl-CoA synthetase
LQSSRPELLWEPTEEAKKNANITRYTEWLGREEGLHFRNYQELWSWSVRDLEGFWETIWKYFRLTASKGYSRVLPERRMPGARWFEGAELNYASNVLRAKEQGGPAIISVTEEGKKNEVSWEELRRETASVASALRTMGVKKGDRVAAYIPNIPEAVVALLACASLGAIWSSCSPDFGAPSVIDRFKQVEPKVLVAIDGYRYGGKVFDRSAVVKQISGSLPTLEGRVLLHAGEKDSVTPGLKDVVAWDEFLIPRSKLDFEPLPFDHPLWILYTSGTTGLPKPIVHGHGGILLEHLKVLALHNDLKPSDRFFWFTTTGWMMWNYLVGGLLLGSSIILYDGSPTFPRAESLWTLADETEMTVLGTSAAFINYCMKEGVEEAAASADLGRLRSVGSTGSPLSIEGFQWVYKLKRDVWLASISGGTDLCTAFVGGCPILPVYAGEIQCRALGADVQSFDEGGRPEVNRMGELVLTSPMPSMPLFLWGDEDGRRYKASYFDTFPGIWRHGDWIAITDRGTCIIYGRADATLKRMGVRIGTSEIYRIVEAMPEVSDSLVFDLEGLGGRSYMPLFVVLSGKRPLDDDLKVRIKRKISEELSRRAVPDEVFEVPAVPRTLSGKKLEVPIRKIFLGATPEEALNRDSLSNPESVDYFVQLAAKLRQEAGRSRR